MKLEYKKNLEGAWEVYIDDKSYGLSLFLPDGYKPEDYKIDFDFLGGKEAPRKCENLRVEVLNSPKKTKGPLYFDCLASIRVEDNVVLCVKDSIYLAFNNNVTIASSVKPDEDGFRRIYRDNLSIKTNENITIGFAEPKTLTVKGISEDFDLTWLDDGLIADNKNIYMALYNNNGFINIVGNSYKSHRENNDKTFYLYLRSDHNAIRDCKFVFDSPLQAPNELGLQADFIFLSNIILTPEKLSEIKVSSKNQEELSTIEMRDCSLLIKEAKVNVNAQTFSIKEGKGKIYSILGINELESEKEVRLSVADSVAKISNVKIKTKGENLTIEDSQISNAIIDIIEDLDGNSSYIRDNLLFDCNIKNHRGELSNLDFQSSILDSCFFAKNSKMFLPCRNSVEVEGDFKLGYIHYEINNLELKEDASLKANFKATWPKEVPYDDSFGKNIQIEINNTVVEGFSHFDDFLPTKVENSVLKNASVFIHSPDTKITNSILEEGIYLTNISSLSNSEFNQVMIKAKEATSIDGERLNSKRIFNWEDFVSERDAKSKADTTSLSVEELEIL